MSRFQPPSRADAHNASMYPFQNCEPMLDLAMRLKSEQGTHPIIAALGVWPCFSASVTTLGRR